MLAMFLWDLPLFCLWYHEVLDGEGVYLVFRLGIQHALRWLPFKICFMSKSLAVWNDICTVQPTVILS